MDEGVDPEVKRAIEHTISYLREQGAIVEMIDLPILKAAIAAYYIICPAEVSTNMARFDGLRFGLQGDTSEFERMHDYYASIRDEGF